MIKQNWKSHRDKCLPALLSTCWMQLLRAPCLAQWEELHIYSSLIILGEPDWNAQLQVCWSFLSQCLDSHKRYATLWEGPRECPPLGFPAAAGQFSLGKGEESNNNHKNVWMSSQRCRWHVCTKAPATESWCLLGILGGMKFVSLFCRLQPQGGGREWIPSEGSK